MSETKKVVFICGCPRSGTTLLGSMLGAAEGCVSTPESQFITDVAAEISKGKIAPNVKEIQAFFSRHFRLKLWDIVEEISSEPAADLTNSLQGLIQKCVDLYAKKKDQLPWHTWIDHTPSHIRYINTLSGLFPDSRFIHLIRDGRGVFSSTRFLDWGPAGAIQAAGWWTMRVAPGLAAEDAFSERILRVRFEDLVNNPEGELQRICEFAGLEFSSAMIEGKGFVVPEYSKGQHSLVGSPPDISASDKWKEKLTSREIEIFESLCGPLLEYLGYDSNFGLKAAPPNRREKLNEMLLSRPKKTMARLLKRYSRSSYIQ